METEEDDVAARRELQIAKKEASRAKRLQEKSKVIVSEKISLRVKLSAEAEMAADETELKKVTEAKKKKTTKKKRPRMDGRRRSFMPPIGGTSLIGREWENEIARNILTIYNANMGEDFPGQRRVEPFNMRTHPRAIWYMGSGRIQAVWCGLTASQEKDNQIRASKCSHGLCSNLRHLEKDCKYDAYIDLVDNLLQEFSRKRVHERAEARQLDSLEERKRFNAHSCAKGQDHNIEISRREMKASEDAYMIDFEILDPLLLASRDVTFGQIERKMWRQLAVCCSIFGIKFTEQKKFGPALTLFKRAETLLEQTSALEGGNAFVGNIKLQLKAFLWDGLAFYYFRRRKVNAAALYSKKALRVHFKLEQWEHVAKCHLHCASVLSMMSKHEEAIACLKQVLYMVEDGRLEVRGNSAQKVCMLAITFHNVAVEHLLQGRPGEACTASQNARRLAKVSLSYSNRWINQLEKTHAFAVGKLSKQNSFVKQTLKKSANRVFEKIAKELDSS